MKWRTDEPPKDSIFLADVGLPYAVVCSWNGTMNGHWVYADFNVGMFHGDWVDAYFENEWQDVEVKVWMELPEIEQ